MSDLIRNNRRTLRGVVVSDKMDKTIVVNVDRSKKHRLYKKSIIVSKKYKADNPDNKAKLGDLVEIMECRPMSKTKSYRLHNIISQKQRDYASATEEAKILNKEEDVALEELTEKEKPMNVSDSIDSNDSSFVD